MSKEMAGTVLGRISAERIEADIARLEGVRHPVSAPEALAAAAEAIHDRLAALGYEIEEHWFNDAGVPYRNILAARGGRTRAERTRAGQTRAERTRAEEEVWLMAHYDTVAESPGADDNASAVAVLLESARVLADVPTRRTVRFVAVNLEERGPDGDPSPRILRGSRALAQHARVEGWKIVGIANLECVGYAGEGVPQRVPAGVPIEAPPQGDFLAVVGNEASRELLGALERATRRHRVALPLLPLVVPGNGEVLPDLRRSDHAAFWDQGYPALMLTDTADFRNPHYHQPSDTLETLNLAFMAALCQATTALVLDLAGIVD